MNQCSKCRRKAVYKRKYSGEVLCKSCFSDSIVEKTRKTISQYKMLKYGDKIALGVSGGKDSLSLLHILSKISEPYGTKVYAITVDEGIDGYREEAVGNAKEFASKLGVQQLVLSYKELYGLKLDESLERRNGKKVAACTICGILRRRALDMGAKKVAANVVATAHNLDDALQTFMINLLSGDVERIKWLDPASEPKRIFGLKRIKPLMEVYEEEIAYYAFLNDIPFQTVSCPHMSESIRSDIRVILNRFEDAHPGMKYNMFRSMMNIAKNLKIETSRDAKPCLNCGFPCSGDICSVCSLLLSPLLQLTQKG
ncbi:MAG: TIGR00269 family protein [Thaumarchaeota archaeon]|nr:TIGR00269 family protein [Nitrososphaerota archaeon]